MRRTLIALLVLGAAAAGCESKPKPPPAPAAPAAAKPAAPAAAASATTADAPAAPEKEKGDDWAYSSVGKRDPFRSFLAELELQGGALATRCATPLGKFELEQLKLRAVIVGLEDPVAMVEAPNGTGYTVRRGACMGKNGGIVAAVRSGEVVVTEWAIRADGTKEKTQTVLRLPKEAALNLEE
ncbi:MAG TPA: pilus assembly protein PilP [Anaeromyxobacteraceae bacterium]|nr:pilus assembly protein PilP [Anaeromyxobacteraceae bacterium]